jgi:hypothetical protein
VCFVNVDGEAVMGICPRALDDDDISSGRKVAFRVDGNGRSVIVVKVRAPIVVYNYMLQGHRKPFKGLEP